MKKKANYANHCDYFKNTIHFLLIHKLESVKMGSAWLKNLFYVIGSIFILLLLISAIIDSYFLYDYQNLFVGAGAIMAAFIGGNYALKSAKKMSETQFQIYMDEKQSIQTKKIEEFELNKRQSASILSGFFNAQCQILEEEIIRMKSLNAQCGALMDLSDLKSFIHRSKYFSPEISHRVISLYEKLKREKFRYDERTKAIQLDSELVGNEEEFLELWIKQNCKIEYLHTVKLLTLLKECELLSLLLERISDGEKEANTTVFYSDLNFPLHDKLKPEIDKMLEKMPTSSTI